MEETITFTERELQLLKQGLNSIKEYTTEHDDLFAKLNGERLDKGGINYK